jgi:hypothetical protein
MNAASHNTFTNRKSNLTSGEIKWTLTQMASHTDNNAVTCYPKFDSNRLHYFIMKRAVYQFV